MNDKLLAPDGSKMASLRSHSLQPQSLFGSREERDKAVGGHNGYPTSDHPGIDFLRTKSVEGYVEGLHSVFQNEWHEDGLVPIQRLKRPCNSSFSGFVDNVLLPPIPDETYNSAEQFADPNLQMKPQGGDEETIVFTPNSWETVKDNLLSEVKAATKPLASWLKMFWGSEPTRVSSQEVKANDLESEQCGAQNFDYAYQQYSPDIAQVQQPPQYTMQYYDVNGQLMSVIPTTLSPSPPSKPIMPKDNTLNVVGGPNDSMHPMATPQFGGIESVGGETVYGEPSHIRVVDDVTGEIHLFPKRAGRYSRHTLARQSSSFGAFPQQNDKVQVIRSPGMPSTSNYHGVTTTRRRLMKRSLSEEEESGIPVELAMDEQRMHKGIGQLAANWPEALPPPYDAEPPLTHHHYAIPEDIPFANYTDEARGGANGFGDGFVKMPFDGILPFGDHNNIMGGRGHFGVLDSIGAVGNESEIRENLLYLVKNYKAAKNPFDVDGGARYDAKMDSEDLYETMDGHRRISCPDLFISGHIPNASEERDIGYLLSHCSVGRSYTVHKNFCYKSLKRISDEPIVSNSKNSLPHIAQQTLDRPNFQHPQLPVHTSGKSHVVHANGQFFGDMNSCGWSDVPQYSEHRIIQRPDIGQPICFNPQYHVTPYNLHTPAVIDDKTMNCQMRGGMYKHDNFDCQNSEWRDKQQGIQNIVVPSANPYQYAYGRPTHSIDNMGGQFSNIASQFTYNTPLPQQSQYQWYANNLQTRNMPPQTDLYQQQLGFWKSPPGLNHPMSVVGGMANPELIQHTGDANINSIFTPPYPRDMTQSSHFLENFICDPSNDFRIANTSGILSGVSIPNLTASTYSTFESSPNALPTSQHYYQPNSGHNLAQSCSSMQPHSNNGSQMCVDMAVGGPQNVPISSAQMTPFSYTSQHNSTYETPLASSNDKNNFKLMGSNETPHSHSKDTKNTVQATQLPNTNESPSSALQLYTPQEIGKIKMFVQKVFYSFLEGWLEKRNPSGWGFKSRFIVLREFKMKYFKNSLDTEPKGCLTLDASKWSVYEDEKSNNGFTMSASSDDRVFYWRIPLDSPNSIKDWLEALRKKIKASAFVHQLKDAVDCREKIESTNTGKGLSNSGLENTRWQRMGEAKSEGQLADGKEHQPSEKKRRGANASLTRVSAYNDVSLDKSKSGGSYKSNRSPHKSSIAFRNLKSDALSPPAIVSRSRTSSSRNFSSEERNP